eukprot:SM000072S21159  [mRNA]  locus=s72:15362:21149:+ [translate_table: standard]
MRAVVIAGTHSGVGKTCVAIGLMAAYRRRGLRVQPFKVGPDFLDPMHHKAATGRDSLNLDGWMLSRDVNIACFLRAAPDTDLAVVEGCMGLFDGRDGLSEAGSTAEMAKILGAPVVLVLDCWALARSAAAMVLGYASFDPDLVFAGVVFNKVGGAAHAEWLQEAVEAAEVGATVLGGVPKSEAATLPERHLGLAMPGEPIVPADYIARLSDLVEAHLDLDAILQLAAQLDPPPPPQLPPFGEVGSTDAGIPRTPGKAVRIGVAQDAAFCFYYHENLALLHDAGAELVFFSLVDGPGLPPRLDAIYLGGGYPELHALALSRNTRALYGLRAFAAAGGLIYGECGGLMYLSQGIQASVDPSLRPDPPSVGRRRVVPQEGCQHFPQKHGSLRGQYFHFSEVVAGTGGASLAALPTAYVTDASLAINRLPSSPPSLLVPSFTSAALSVEASYHYHPRRRFTVQRQLPGAAPEPEGYVRLNVLATYVHVHFGSNTAAAHAFVDRASLPAPSVVVTELSGGGGRAKLRREVSWQPGYVRPEEGSGGAEREAWWEEGGGGAGRYRSAEAPAATMAAEGRNPWGRAPPLYRSESAYPASGGGGGGEEWEDEDDGGGGGLGGRRRASAEARVSSGTRRSGAGGAGGGGGEFVSKRSRPGFTSRAAVSGGSGIQRPWPRQQHAWRSGGGVAAAAAAATAGGGGGTRMLLLQPPPPLRIVSFLPAATEILAKLGVGDRLIGISGLCDYPADVGRGRHVVSRSKVDATKMSSADVETTMRRLEESGESPFEVDTDWLRRAKPDLVFTQDSCERCDASESEVGRALAAAGLLGSPSLKIVMLRPRTLSEVLAAILQVGEAAVSQPLAQRLVDGLRARLRGVATAVAGRGRRRIASLEGLVPLALGGHWLSEVKSMAGGEDCLHEPGAPAERIAWERILAAAPDVLVLSPCSSSPNRTLTEVEVLAGLPGFWSVPAVRAGEVYIVDHVFFSRPGPRLVDGVEVLAQILHPAAVSGRIPPETVLKLSPPPSLSPAAAGGGTYPRADEVHKLFHPFPP